MKTANLTALQRFKIQELCMQQQGTPVQLAPVLRIYEKIRFDDEEQQQIKFGPAADGRTFAQWPNSGWGERSVQLETEEAARLAQIVENFPQFTIADLTWTKLLLEQLK